MEIDPKLFLNPKFVEDIQAISAAKTKVEADKQAYLDKCNQRVQEIEGLAESILLKWMKETE